MRVAGVIAVFLFGMPLLPFAAEPIAAPFDIVLDDATIVSPETITTHNPQAMPPTEIRFRYQPDPGSEVKKLIFKNAIVTGVRVRFTVQGMVHDPDEDPALLPGFNITTPLRDVPLPADHPHRISIADLPDAEKLMPHFTKQEMQALIRVLIKTDAMYQQPPWNDPAHWFSSLEGVVTEANYLIDLDDGRTIAFTLHYSTGC